MATAVTYAMKRHIRRRHSLSIGACGRSCSADKHLKAVEERESRKNGACVEQCVAQNVECPVHCMLLCAWPRAGVCPRPSVFDQRSAHGHPAHAHVDVCHHARQVMETCGAGWSSG